RRDGDALRRIFSALRETRDQDWSVERSAHAVRSEEARRGTCAGTRPAVRLSRTANALRSLFPRRSVCRRPPFRIAAVLFHARRDGIGIERGRPRSALDRVLQRAVDIRLHELDADAVQLRYASLTIVVVLSDHGLR